MILPNEAVVQHDRNISIMLNLTAAVSLLFCLYLLAVPSMQKNAVVGQYSWERLGMAGSVLLVALLVKSAQLFYIRATVLRKKQVRRYETWLDQGKLHLFWDTAVLFLIITLYLLFKWNFINEPHSLVPRLNIFLILAALMFATVLAAMRPLLRQARPLDQQNVLPRIQGFWERHRRFPIALVLVVGFLLLSDLGSGWLRGTTYGLLIDDLFREFDVGWEYVLPAYVSGLMLLLAGGLLAFIAIWKFRFHQLNKVYWMMLSAIFLYMAADEVFLIHETKWRSPLAGYVLEVAEEFELLSYFHYTWTATGVVFVLFFGLVFLRFFLSLPNYYKIGFFLSGLVFVSGALGIELVSGNLFVNQGYGGLYNTLEIVEEGLEMSGMVIFISTLIRYIREMKPDERKD